MEIATFAPAIFVQGSRPEANEISTAGSACDQDGATHVYFDACEITKDVTVVGNADGETLGRVLNVAVTLKDVCPGRASSLGIHLSEMDEEGAESACGFRAVSIPAHQADCHKDVQLDTIRFVLPEDHGAKQRRHLVIRTTHHYLNR